jgi:hypothetical protein
VTNKDENVVRNGILKADVARATASAPAAAFWTSDNFAQDWFADALHEARTGKEYNSRRREIIFAVCFAESYIFEWARSILQIKEINDYFPPERGSPRNPRYRRPTKDKWKEIPKELHKAGKILAAPQLDLRELGELINYRDGLVHAAASRPATDSQPKETRPYPTKDMLRKLKPGCAVRIVVDLVRNLHQAIGTPVPEYIENP